MFLLKINFYTLIQNFKAPSVVAVGIVSGCTFDCWRAVFNIGHFLYVAHEFWKGGQGAERILELRMGGEQAPDAFSAST